MPPAPGEPASRHRASPPTRLARIDSDPLDTQVPAPGLYYSAFIPMPRTGSPTRSTDYHEPLEIARQFDFDVPVMQGQLACAFVGEWSHGKSALLNKR